MGFDISKYKAPTDNGRWVETEIGYAIKVFATNEYFDSKLNEMEKNPDCDYHTVITNEHGAHIHIHTCGRKLNEAMEFINSGKHPKYKSVKFNAWSQFTFAEFITKEDDTVALFYDIIEGKLDMITDEDKKDFYERKRKGVI